MREGEKKKRRKKDDDDNGEEGEKKEAVDEEGRGCLFVDAVLFLVTLCS